MNKHEVTLIKTVNKHEVTLIETVNKHEVTLIETVNKHEVTLIETLKAAECFSGDQCLYQRNSVFRQYQRLSASRGFTLIELIIAIGISVMIAAALYLSLKSALDIWQTSQDQLLLQQVSSRVMEEIMEGLPDTYGLRDALEIVEAGPRHVSVVMPWTDDTHDVYSGIHTYTLNKHIKPGAGLPIAEALLPGAKDFKVVPLTLADAGKTDDRPDVRLNISVPAGSRLRFTFHPDHTKDADVLTVFRCDESEQAVFIDDKDGSRDIARNIFGIKITDFLIRYFDNTNTEAGMDGSVSDEDIASVTGIEVAFKARSKSGSVRETVSFISMRNAPMRTGNITIREGTTVPIPNSRDVKAFFLTNLGGIDNDDTLILEASPKSGKSWRVTVRFSRTAGQGVPMIELYTIEYPPGNKVYSDRPRVPASLGLNLMSLDPNGRYDYDDDGMQDVVMIDGDACLEVKKMDVKGAAVFVKP